MATSSFTKKFEIKDPAVAAKLLRDIEAPASEETIVKVVLKDEKAETAKGIKLLKQAFSR